MIDHGGIWGSGRKKTKILLEELVFQEDQSTHYHPEGNRCMSDRWNTNKIQNTHKSWWRRCVDNMSATGLLAVWANTMVKKHYKLRKKTSLWTETSFMFQQQHFVYVRNLIVFLWSINNVAVIGTEMSHQRTNTPSISGNIYVHGD